ncbi:MAG: alpha/beta fold hydrolase [Thermoleophilaceae bacterium]
MAIREYTGLGGRLAPIRTAREAGDDYGATADPEWRGVDWQAHLHDVAVRGRRVNYVDIGESKDGRPPVVFVHGLGGCWQNWLENIPRAAQERRVIAMDLPGFSCSEMPAEKITISNYARSVVELLEAIGMEGPAEVVGNSMGGFIAAEIGINHPEHCRRIALVSAAGISITNLRRRPVMTTARATAAVTNFVIARRGSFVRRPTLRHVMLGYVLRHPTRIKPDLAFQIMYGAGSGGFLPALDALTDYDFRDRLGEVKCPTLLVWGSDDNLVPVEDADEFERLIPNARKVILEDTGHAPMIERPQTFNDLLMDFLNDAPASDAPDDVAEKTGAAA